ncbi:MAG: glutathione S-transferase [Proteobacteria bacterium]|nr:glutathione S-transferase [Pseudomonadota bacterium]
MKLFFAGASPFARKVMAVAYETGVANRLTLVPTTVTPVAKDKLIAPYNPAGKIPTLVTEAGEAIYDSRVICEYLDVLAGGGRMFPTGEGRWKALVLQSLCDEALDSCLAARYETMLRPENLRWQDWINGHMGKVRQALDTLENDWVPYLNSNVNIGTITACSLLGYLDLRFPDEDWRSARPAIAVWHKAYSQRPAMAKTVPVV